MSRVFGAHASQVHKIHVIIQAADSEISMEVHFSHPAYKEGEDGGR